MQEQPHEIELRAVSHAEDWKRKFQKEIKVNLLESVNQELGRRLRLRKECARCHTLQEEVDELKKRLRFQEQLQSNQENEESVDLEATVVQHDDFDDEASDLPTSSSANNIANASVASPLSVKQNEPQGDENVGQVKPIEPPEAQDGTPKTKQADPIQKSTSRPHHPSQERQQELANRSVAHENTSIPTPALHQATSFNSFIGYDDSSSLGELFKYAVVLAGPMATKPPRIPLVKRKSFADFRRTRSLPEGGSQPDSKAPKLSTVSALTPSADNIATTPWSPPSTPSKFKLLTRPTRLTSRYSSQTLLEFIAEEQPTPSPQRKPGWLANLVSQRFRGTITTATTQQPPAATVEAPARLISTTEEQELEASSPPPVAAPVAPASKMVCVFPPQTKDVAELEGLVELCFPYGERGPQASEFTLAALKRTLQERHRTYRNANSTFVLTIASASNPCEITYAICVICPLFADEPPLTSCDPQQQHDAGSIPDADTSLQGGQQSTQCCLCLLSPYPFFSLFFKVLFGVAVLWEEKRKAHTTNYALALKDKQLPLPTPLALSDFVAHFQAILSRLQRMRIPSMGGWSRMVLSPDITQLSFHRPHSESVAMERRTLLLEYAAPTLFALLSVDQVLFLLGCLCCEQKVLVVSDHVNIVSSCVLALITLLGPLQWAGPVITVLPPRLDELLEAPVPLIAGRVSINSSSIPEFSTLAKPMKGVIEMNMDQNNLSMHSDDLMNYHELKLPGCDALVHELAYFASQLFAKHNDPEFPTVQQAEACEIICTRIHRHFDFLCSLALGENSEIGDVGVVPERFDRCVFSSHDNNAIKNSDAAADFSLSSSSTTDTSRRFSDLTGDYIRRFKETQMFSMFQLQRQEQHAKDAATAAAEDDDDDDDDDDDEPHRDLHDDDDDVEENGAAGDDRIAASCDTDALFTDDAIIYEPDALCCVNE